MTSEIYEPSSGALRQRERVFNMQIVNRCQFKICIEQRKISTVPKDQRYKLYVFCRRCRTNWDKGTKYCPCCGYQTRNGPRKKTPYRNNMKDYI